MNDDELLASIRKNTILGRVDEQDEGFDGDLEGEPGVTELVQTAIAQNVPAARIISEALSPAMDEVGAKYESEEYLIPDMLAGAECVSAAMDLLKPHLAEADVEQKGMVVVATVEGDRHDIGKNIVATLLKGAGYDVRDLGTSVPASRIVEEVRATGARFVGLSALLTSTMVKMPVVIEALKEAGLREGVRVVVGGAPVSEQFAAKIGADAYCRDAFEAVDRLEELRAQAV
ncbi:MAG: corrinoid protein [Candidatus Eiseniibacteriota bacterium]|jgi:5-methyltetrahydrofolate--homocysteine methyltransferase